jgi:hypothetical protein
VSQKVLFVIVVIGLLVAEVLGHWGGDQIPLRLVVPGLVAAAAILAFVGRLLKRRGMLK